MRIISDITGQEYRTVDECLAAEEIFLQRRAEEEAKEKAFQKKKDEAYRKAMTACDEYLKLRGIELELIDGGYKIIVHSNDTADKIFEDILNLMW